MKKKRGPLPANTYKLLGARLWELRAARVVSCADVAAGLGCSSSMLQQVERGAALPTIDLLTRWADALGAEAEKQTLLALHQEDARAACQAGVRVKARVMVSRVQAPRS